MSDDRNGFFSMVCFLAGAAVGAGLALLYAPQAGTETRKQLKDASDKVSDEIKANYDKISDEAKKSIDQVKVSAEKAIENVKVFVEKTKDAVVKDAEAAAPVKKKTTEKKA